MKRSLKASLRLVALICGLPLVGLAQSPNPVPDLLALSKDARGPITRNSLALTLRANPECDQTQLLIPDDSRLVAEQFTLNTDQNGRGTFHGLAQVVTPAGRVVLQGWLRGTVGVNTRCGADRQCRLPWHLEGLFEAVATTFTRSLARLPDVRLQVVMLNFSADLDQRVAGPVPIYDARLDGMLSPPPLVAEQVSITADKPAYNLGELITAIIANQSEQTITAFDQQTYCTIVQLQIQEGDQWRDYSVCPLNRQPTPTSLRPGQKIEVKLDPHPPSLNPFPPGPGVYRLAFTFYLGAVEVGAGDRFVVASTPFRINPAPADQRVAVTTDRDAYRVGEVITVRIRNDQERPILAWDHKSYCGIVYLQKQEGNDWVRIAPCLLLSPTRPVPIGAQQDYLLKLPPENAMPQLAPGIYRIEFTYYLVNSAGLPVGEAVTVYSPLFRVNSRE